MWKHIRRVVTLAGVPGGGLFALSSHSIPASITDADGYLVTNLRWFGWVDPPRALASTAADHWTAALGALLVVLALIVGMWSIFERRADRSAKPATYVSPKEAIRYLADETVWGWNIRKKRTPGIINGTPVAMRMHARFAALSEFQDQASREGTALKVYGTKFGSAQADLIPHIFWMTNGLSGTRLFSEAECETEPTTWAQSPDKFGDLKVDQAGLFATWPRLGPLKRWLLRREMRREQEEWANGK